VKGPLVSFVVPVYNGERFIGSALESIFAQDYEPFEVIVVDDGSTDRSGEIAETFGDVTVVRQPNAGPAAARNAGIGVAGGEFVAIHDADDLLPPSKLALQVTYLLEHPETACVLGRQKWIDPPPGLQRDPIYGELDGIPMPSAVFRSDALREIGGYDDSFRSHENIDVLFRLRERGNAIAVLDEIVLFRRFHGGNISHVAWPDRDPRLRSLKAKLDRSRAESGEHT
jgi:glycosyltransferase involved in cell wall biosynthesis